MEKFNPNKKNWEPLCCDTTVKKYRPAPKDLKKPEIPELPKKQHSHFRVNGRNRKYGHWKGINNEQSKTCGGHN